MPVTLQVEQVRGYIDNKCALPGLKEASEGFPKELHTLSLVAEAYRDSVLTAREKRAKFLEIRHRKRHLSKIAVQAYDEGYEAGYEDGCEHSRNERFEPKTKKKPYYSNYCLGYFEGYHDGFMDTIEEYMVDGEDDDDDEDWELEEWEE